MSNEYIYVRVWLKLNQKRSKNRKNEKSIHSCALIQLENLSERTMRESDHRAIGLASIY